MERMMKQLNLITQHVVVAQRVNIVQATSNLPYEYESSENVHEEEVCFIGSQVLDSWSAFQWSLKNQGLNIGSGWADDR